MCAEENVETGSITHEAPVKKSSLSDCGPRKSQWKS